MAQPDAELASRLLELRQYIDQLELECSQLAAEFNESKHWERQGSNSAIDWMRFHCHMTSNAAADRVAVGERAAEMPESVQAMRAGDIGFAHLTVMARTANAVGEAFNEEQLLQLARDNSPGKFHYKCLHYRHSVNSNQYAKEQAELAETNILHMNRRDDGSFFLTGFLDPVGGAVVRSALEPLARTLGKDDHRLRPQRMADALIELAGHKQKDPDAGHELDRDLARPHRRAWCGERVLAPHLLEDGRALGLRLQPDQSSDAGLGGDRCRPGGAHDQRPQAAGARRPRPALPLARLRATGLL